MLADFKQRPACRTAESEQKRSLPHRAILKAVSTGKKKPDLSLHPNFHSLKPDAFTWKSADFRIIPPASEWKEPMNGIRSRDPRSSKPMSPLTKAPRPTPGFTAKSATLAIALCGLATVLLIDLLSSAISLLGEGPPLFDGFHILRTCLIATSSGILVMSLAHPGTRISRPCKPEWRSWGTVSWVSPEPDQRPRLVVSAKRLAVLTMMALAAGMVVIFLWSPGMFYKLGKEDHPVEALSAGIHFLNSVLFLFIGANLHQRLDRKKMLGSLAALGFAFTFFLIGMEEVSWFQRQLEVETPASFSQNMQGELNLHNFATDEIETLYYLAVFVVLVLFPFTSHILAHWAGDGALKIFIPPPFIAYVGAVIASFNYDMWNTLTTQTPFFVSLFILIYYLKHHSAALADKLTNISVLILVVATQVIFVAAGDRFVRLHDVTEYKELLIPVAFLIYAGNLLFQLRTGVRR